MPTELKIKAAKPQEKAYKLSDEKGLYLLVQTTGGKLWRFDYRVRAEQLLIFIRQPSAVGWIDVETPESISGFGRKEAAAS